MLQTLSSRGFRPPHSPAGASLRKALNAELCQRNSSGRGSDTLKKDRGQVISGDIPPCPHNTLDPPFLPTFSTRMTAHAPPVAVSSFVIVSVCFIILIVSVCFIFCQCVFCLLSVCFVFCQCVLSFVSVYFIFCQCVFCLLSVCVLSSPPSEPSSCAL